MTASVSPGQRVWVMSRELARKGSGPIEHVVAEVLLESGRPWAFRPVGTRGAYPLSKTYSSALAAAAAAEAIIGVEASLEFSRSNAIAKKLEMSFDAAKRVAATARGGEKT